MLIVCPKCSAQYQIPDEVRLISGKKLKCSNCQHVFVWHEEVPVVETAVSETESMPEPVEQAPVSENKEENVFLDEPAPVFQEEMPQPFLPVVVPESKSQSFMGRLAALFSLIVLIVVVGLGFVYRDVLFHTLIPVTEHPKSVVLPIQKSVAESSENVGDSVQKKDSDAGEVSDQITDVVVLPEIQSVRFEKRQDSVPTIRIEGILKNSHDTALRLPEKVRAIAYNHDGVVLFEKDIYLTDSILPAGEERPFFGSYQPAPDGIQWVDVTF